MNLEVDKKTFDEIAKVIHSDNSPVGIDAKKTHILILNALSNLNKKMDRIEAQLKELNN